MEIISPGVLSLVSFVLVLAFGLFSLHRSNGYSGVSNRQRKAELDFLDLRERLIVAEARIKEFEKLLNETEVLNRILGRQISELIAKTQTLQDANENLVKRNNAAEATAAALRNKYGTS
jgi:hypothetical protein